MTMFYFRLFPEKKLKQFFFKKTPPFLAPCAHFCVKKKHVPLNSVAIRFCFFKIQAKYYCVKIWRKSNEWFPSNSGFRRTHAYMHGTGVSWNTSYFISFWLWDKLFVLTGKMLVVIIQWGHCNNLVSWSSFLYANFNFLYDSVDILPGAGILLKNNQLKKQQITPNTEQFKGGKLL